MSERIVINGELPKKDLSVDFDRLKIGPKMPTCAEPSNGRYPEATHRTVVQGDAERERAARNADGRIVIDAVISRGEPTDAE